MDEDLESFKVNLGKKIKSIRELQGLTQPELGALIDKDYQSISRIESGKINPSGYVLWQIAKALKIQISEIFPL
jgi:putative transcriptional regulator